MRPAAAARLALGAALLARPAAPARVTRTSPSGDALLLTRVLGVRYAAQGALGLAVPMPRQLGAGVELAHAATMLLVARRSGSHARLALLSAAVAGGVAGLDQIGGRR